jgi:hypothetical protein
LYMIFFLYVVDILNYFSTLYMTACNILFGPSYYIVYSVISIHYEFKVLITLLKMHILIALSIL